MKTLIADKPVRILKAKKQLEKKLNLKIGIEGNKVTIDGKPEDEYLGEKVLEAFDFGFPFSDAIRISEELNIFEVINIKEHTHRKDLKVIRARIIGRGGKTLKVMRDLTDCAFEIKDNEVGIIGKAENMPNGKSAVLSVIRGAKQADVYSYLEKHRIAPVDDWGLKDEKDKENL